MLQRRKALGRPLRPPGALALRFRPMWSWSKRHAGILAIGFGVTTLGLAVVVAFQAAMLHTRGWRVPLGTMPEWLSGVGALATFGAVWVAVQQLRIGQKERKSLETERQALAATREAERRDHEMSQARLIIAEIAPARDFVVKNHSAAPIFDLIIHAESPLDPRVRVFVRDANQNLFGSNRQPVLAPGESSAGLHLQNSPSNLPIRGPVTEHVGFTFTDARGARWRRHGSEQPVQLLKADETLKPETALSPPQP